MKSTKQRCSSVIFLLFSFLDFPFMNFPSISDGIQTAKAERQLHLTGMEIAGREAARLHTTESLLSKRTKEQALAAHFSERSTQSE